MADTPNLEIEWQFDAADLGHVKKQLMRFIKTLPYKSQFQKPVKQIDTYYETDDFTYFHAGFCLRIRRKGGSYEASLKSLLNDAQEGFLKPKRRIEISEKLPGPNKKHLLTLKGELGEKIRSKHPKSSLIELFTLETVRERIILKAKNLVIAEIALDKTEQVDETLPDTPFELSRIEIEVKDPAYMLTLHDLVGRMRSFLKNEGCPVKPAKDSKFMAAYRHNKITATSVDFGAYSFNRKMSIESYVVAILKKYLAVAIQQESGCRLGQDVEYIHRMRVSLRKVLSAMKVFSKIQPKRLPTYHDFLKKLITSLGVARDLDVQLASLSSSKELATDGDNGALLELIQYLTKKRDQAHKDLMTIFNSKTYSGVISVLRDILNDSSAHQAESVSAGQIYQSLIGNYVKRFKKGASKLSEDASSTSFHKVRIRGKELRYTLEFFKPIREKKITKVIALMSSIQDQLGAINDCRVAKERLTDIVKKKADHFSALAVFKIGQASMHYVISEAENRKAFIEGFAAIDWDQLLKGI